MRVFTDINAIPQFNHSIITIGTFDGVHRGHQKITHQIVSSAAQLKSESIIITFYPHPRQVIVPEKPVYHLNTLDEKLEHLTALGVDNVIVVPFSREFSEMDATDYAENFLIKKFHPAIIVFGYDHKFGRNREGDIHLLTEIAGNYNIRVQEISAESMHDITVSSTSIRNYLLAGNISEANALLGYAYSLTGLVVKGDQIGRTLNFPTANMHIDDAYKLIPADGVYIVSVKLKDKGTAHYGLLSIGTRPTFNKTEKRIEVYILDFSETIYGEEITIHLLEFIRSDKKFNSKAELIEAMEEDKRKGLQFLQNLAL